MARARGRAAVSGPRRHQYRLLQCRELRQQRPEIIGAEANLAARLQSIAQANGIVLSYETYALVRDLVRAYPLPPIHIKGISREVVPYAVEGLLGELPQREQVISEHGKGLDLFIDLDVLEDNAAERTKQRLRELLDALERRPKPA